MQRRVRSILIFASIFTLVVSAFGSLPAHASSVYDDAYRTTSSLLVGRSVSYGSNPAVPDQDVTSSWSSYILDASTPGYSSDAAISLRQAFSSGRWVVSGQEWLPSAGVKEKQVIVFWTTCDALALDWYDWGLQGHVVVASGNSSCWGNRVILSANSYTGTASAHPVVIGAADMNIGGTIISNNKTDYTDVYGGVVKNLFAYSDNTHYPSGYEGSIVSAGSDDIDNDGLPAGQENAQGTSDNDRDTDGDGLSDYVESEWYPSRDNIFCKTSMTPYVCVYPHPSVRDVFVEMDWMNDGTNSFKPSDTQIGLVSDAFANQGIYFHADTGQYGGGNQLSTYTAPLSFEKGSGTDYFDYKDSNFSTDRQGIWRYMISGNNYSQEPNSSGATYAGSDNIFISYGYIDSHQSTLGYIDRDTAIAGTMIHEIGHSLCLSSVQRYSYQNSGCVYAGIDSTTSSYPSYASSMNYTDQMSMVDYSTGVNGSPSDHDDWSMVGGNMADFTVWDYDTQHDYSPGVSGKKPHLEVAITGDIAQSLKKRGLLRTGKANWRHLKVVPKKDSLIYKSKAILHPVSSPLTSNRF